MYKCSDVIAIGPHIALGNSLLPSDKPLLELVFIQVFVVTWRH